MKETQSAVREADTAGVSASCEVTVTVQLAKWLRWPKFSTSCKKPATWVAINMCCASRSMACERHHDLAGLTMRGLHIRCGECSAITTLIWSRLS